MLKKNLDIYKNKYSHVSKDQQERIEDFLRESQFSPKDLKNLNKRFYEIANLQEEAIKLVFYIIPEPTPRPRINYSRGVFYVKNAHSNNEFLRLVMDNEKDIQQLIVTPCTFTCDCYFPIPDGLTKVDKLLAEMGMIKPIFNKDWDNLGKTYSDMVQKWLLLNDALITSGTTNKYFSFKPRVEITISWSVGYDCKFNKKLVERSKVYKEANLHSEETVDNENREVQ